MEEKNDLKDAIAEAADKHLTTNPEIVISEDMPRTNVTFECLNKVLRKQTVCFLWDVMRSIARDETAATPDGVIAIAEVATALRKYL